MHNDVKALIQKCEACRIHSSIPRKLKQEMTPITSAWPFYQWGINIVGPLSMAPGGARHGMEDWEKRKKHQVKHGMKIGKESPRMAIVPIKISVETHRVKEFKVKLNEKRSREDLDILEERREIASIREAHYKQKLERYYNKRVRPSTFKPGRVRNGTDYFAGFARYDKETACSKPCSKFASLSNIHHHRKLHHP
ncbi:hypothetical protein Tco_0580169 [Tanacetum coccineum]